MISPFATLTPKDALAALKLEAAAAALRAYKAGDHWQGGSAWSGPRPDSLDPNAATMMTAIEKGFVSSNAIDEVSSRRNRAVIGKEPQTGYTVRRTLGKIQEQQDDGTFKEVDARPLDAEQVLIDEAEAVAATSRWDSGRFHLRLREAGETKQISVRSALRLYVPSGFLEDGVLPTVDTLEKSLNRVFLQHPLPEQCAVLTDEATQQQCGIYATDKVTEIWYVDTVEGKANTTVLRRIEQGKEGEQVYYFDYGGRIPIYEMSSPPLITPQIVQLQNALNKALTMQSHNDNAAAFQETTYLGAQAPGDWVEDPTTKKKTFVPGDLPTGAGARNFIVGTEYTDSKTGTKHVTTPSMYVTPPVDPKTTIASQDSYYNRILKEASQLHVILSGDGNASGTSRQQAKGDFDTSTSELAAEINAAGRWLLETLLAMGAVGMGKPGKYEGLRATFECTIDTGPLTPEDRKAILDEVAAEVESKEGGMMRLGRPDPDATFQQILEEAKAQRVATPQPVVVQPQLAPMNEVEAVTANEART